VEFTPHVQILLDGVDVTEKFVEVSVELGDVTAVGSSQSGKDAVVRTATLSCFEGDFELDQVEPMTEIEISIDRTDPGESPNFVPIFKGFTDESRAEYPRQSLECTDLAKKLQIAYVVDARPYPKLEQDQPMWHVIQDIIDDELADGPTLYSPNGTSGNPINEDDFMDVPMIYYVPDDPYTVEYQSVWDAIQEVAAQTGFFLGYRMHDNTGQFELTLMEPPIDKEIADYTLDWDSDIYVHNMDISDMNIRNYVRVTYDVDEDGQPIYADNSDAAGKYTTMANESQSKYRRRAMEIEEGDSSLLYHRDQAIKLVEFALNDLTRISGDTMIEMPLFPDAKLFDAFNLTDPRYPGSPIFYAIDSIRHSLTFGDSPDARTELICSEQVTSGKTKWQAMESREGRNKPINEKQIMTQTPVPKPRDPIIEPIGVGDARKGITVAYSKPDFRAWSHVECHVADADDYDADFELSSDTLAVETDSTQFEVTRDIDIGKSYWVRLRHVSTGGRKGEPTEAIRADHEPIADIAWQEPVWLADRIILRWTVQTDEDFLEYEIRTDPYFD